ncbi:MAG: methyltransferase [Buchnera aphidicola (Periphyllus lyropictus)]|uniref:methyltransferase n=1 Tax=Buchnera aphidicola TaxID=9 RepID=UPI001EC9AFCF|nr:methyltransferase [Buchnera aphidicola]NIH16808.1 methyltransferase [Buchnera aphidicola (Periphyllus lyropictus)]USS94491.1 methyltransferase [Buchnera aphidicola (Periphyllus lyropictus)]
MNLSKPSQLILIHKKIFSKKKVIFSGNIEDSLPEILKTKNKIIHVQKYHFLKYLKNLKKKNIYIRFLIKKKKIQKYNTIIYFFSKNKKETLFQLKNIISSLKKKSIIFLVGENKSGINSFVNFFKKNINFKKLNYGRKCTIYFYIINKKYKFNLKKYYKIHYLKNIPIIFLPGVFGYKKIDEGSKFLFSLLYKKKIIKKSILDIGSGSGILSIPFANKKYKNKITLSDSCLTSLKCSKKTFKLNNFNGKFKISNFYSNIKKKFDLIISNPPLHKNLKFSTNFIKEIIYKAKFHLKKNGKLIIVSNRNLTCVKYIKKKFKKFKILKENKKFKIFQGSMN